MSIILQFANETQRKVRKQIKAKIDQGMRSIKSLILEMVPKSQ